MVSQAEKKAMKALADNDIHLAYESVRWEFPRGVVFSNVQLFETAKRGSLLLTASNLGLNQDVYSGFPDSRIAVDDGDALGLRSLVAQPLDRLFQQG